MKIGPTNLNDSTVSYFNKLKKPKMESVWANTFLLDDTYMRENIYTEKIKKRFDKNVRI